MLPRIEHDREADAVYVYLRNLPYAYGEDMDRQRRVDYAEDARPIGIELLNVSHGVNLDDLPERGHLAHLLGEHQIKVFV